MVATFQSLRTITTLRSQNYIGGSKGITLLQERFSPHRNTSRSQARSVVSSFLGDWVARYRSHPFRIVASLLVFSSLREEPRSARSCALSRALYSFAQMEAQMSQNMKDPAFLAECDIIWNDFAPYTTVDRVHELIVVHPKHIFLGFVDMTLGFLTRCNHVVQIKLRGLEMVLLNGQFHLNMPTSGEKHWETYFPKTAHDRALWEAMIGTDARTVTAIANVPAAQAAALAGNQPAAGEVPALVAAGTPITAPAAIAGSVGATVQNPFKTGAVGGVVQQSAAQPVVPIAITEPIGHVDPMEGISEP